MANWSSDNYYFGRTVPSDKHGRRDYRETQQRIFQNLQLDPETAFAVESISTFGPAVRLCGEGRWAAPLGLTCSSTAYMAAGITVIDSFFEFTLTREIRVNDVVVFKQTIEEDPESEAPPAELGRYMGTTPDEEAFFVSLWASMEAPK